MYLHTQDATEQALYIFTCVHHHQTPRSTSPLPQDWDSWEMRMAASAVAIADGDGIGVSVCRCTAASLAQTRIQSEVA